MNIEDALKEIDNAWGEIQGGTRTSGEVITSELAQFWNVSNETVRNRTKQMIASGKMKSRSGMEKGHRVIFYSIELEQ